MMIFIVFSHDSKLNLSLRFTYPFFQESYFDDLLIHQNMLKIPFIIASFTFKVKVIRLQWKTISLIK